MPMLIAGIFKVALSSWPRVLFHPFPESKMWSLNNLSKEIDPPVHLKAQSIGNWQK